MVHCGTPTAVISVINPTTNKTWMDRNLGASQVATSSTDSSAYGDLYQWGRFGDGHQCRNSGTTSTLSITDSPGNANFILTSYPHDWRTTQNNNLWQGINGINNPCPIGFRIPTSVELDAEQQSWLSINSIGAYNSPLKLTLAGSRAINGPLDFVDNAGYYWSSTTAGNLSRCLDFTFGISGISNTNRGYGFSIRCIQE